MKPPPTNRDDPNGFQLRFESLFDAGCGYAFPCDSAGHVDMDALGERARTMYFYVRTLVGRDFSPPLVQSCRAS